MALPTLDANFASSADLPRKQMLAKWLVEELGSGSIADYYDLPERYLWAKIAVAAGGPKTEATYISLPTRYVWSDIYNAVAGSSGNHTDWSEKEALGHIAAAYRGDTGNPANLATYINWPWRYKIASIISYLSPSISYNAVIVSGAGSPSVNETYIEIGQYNGKRFYCYIANDPELGAISWNSPAATVPSAWSILSDGGDEFYYSTDNVEFPWQATNWITSNGTEPSPTLTPTNV